MEETLITDAQSTRIDKNEIWREVLASVKVSVTSPVYATWIAKTHLVSLKKTTKEKYLAEVGCLSSFVKVTLETRYYGLIQDALIHSIGMPCDLAFMVKEIEGGTTTTGTPAPLFESHQDDIFVSRLASSRLRPHQIFDNFAVSGSNQMAWAAAQAVAENPGAAYNPLFIWGGVGVGKTHLMNAVGHSILIANNSAKVLLCTGEEFTNDIISGIRNKTTQNFRDKYRRLQALFVDDIQFIAGKDAVQEEFFHTFNAVTGAGGQIIMTSDKPPTDIPKLEERLRSRFEAGLIVDIAPPDFELRCAIIQIKSQEKGMELEQELVQLIAGNIDTARKIEGFLIRLSSEVKLRHVPISEDLIKNLLGRGVIDNDRKKQATPEDLVNAVSAHFSIARRALMGPARARMVARPRQILMYLLRTELHMPYEEVGKMIGGRDHSTVIHAVDNIAQLASSNQQIREDILGIKSSL